MSARDFHSVDRRLVIDERETASRRADRPNTRLRACLRERRVCGVARKFDKLAVWPAYFDTMPTLSGPRASLYFLSLYALAAARSTECILCTGSYLPDNMFAPRRGSQTDPLACARARELLSLACNSTGNSTNSNGDFSDFSVSRRQESRKKGGRPRSPFSLTARLAEKCLIAILIRDDVHSRSYCIMYAALCILMSLPTITPEIARTI